MTLTYHTMVLSLTQLAYAGQRVACHAEWLMTVRWTKVGNLMLFESLDTCAVSALTLAYKFTDLSTDRWTSRFCDFKFGLGAAQTDAIRKSSAVLAAALATVAFPAKGPITVVGAISSGDTVLRPNTPVYSLASDVAAKRGYTFVPNVLTKRSHRSLKTLTGAGARDAEVQGVYAATGPIPRGTVLIFDDFITRGATTGDIVRAITAASPGQSFCAVALAKTERSTYLQGLGMPADNGHVHAEYEALWGVS